MVNQSGRCHSVWHWAILVPIICMKTSSYQWNYIHLPTKKDTTKFHQTTTTDKSPWSLSNFLSSPSGLDVISCSGFGCWSLGQIPWPNTVHVPWLYPRGDLSLSVTTHDTSKVAAGVSAHQLRAGLLWAFQAIRAVSTRCRTVVCFSGFN